MHAWFAALLCLCVSSSVAVAQDDTSRPEPQVTLDRRDLDPDATLELRPIEELCNKVALSLRVLRMHQRLLRNGPPLSAQYLYELHRALEEILEHIARDPELRLPPDCS